VSERFKISENKNASKNTRLDIDSDFSTGRFNRDELAHISRYLLIAERLIQDAKIFEKPLEVLDIGCGELYLARTINHSFHIKKELVISRYVGLDIDEIALARAEKTKPGCFPVELVCGDVTTGVLARFPDKSFDAVVCLEMAEHIQPNFVAGLLAEIRRLARHTVYFSTPNFDGGTGQIPEDHVKEWPYQELRTLINKTGFTIQQEIGVFSNLNKVKAMCKQDARLNNLYQFFSDKMDGNFLSLTMARLIGPAAQNILRVMRP
jgi:SAM-dependent methyltransferase